MSEQEDHKRAPRDAAGDGADKGAGRGIDKDVANAADSIRAGDTRPADPARTGTPPAPWPALAPAAQRIAEAALAHLAEDARADAAHARARENEQAPAQAARAGRHEGVTGSSGASPLPASGGTHASARDAAGDGLADGGNIGVNRGVNGGINHGAGSRAAGDPDSRGPGRALSGQPADGRAHAPAGKPGAGTGETAVPGPSTASPGGTPSAAKAGPAPAAAALGPQGIEEIRNLVATLAACFERGALDDRALARLLVAAEGRSLPATRAGLRRAVDDFDFALAKSRLATLLAECTAGAGRPR
jgi:hypothetical protein